ncbi:ATPase V1 A1 complex subunit E [Pisolithus marmoratus]|nr:ATPase V1 A1 complex subunit E [Pisolithus marmoratus]
MASRPLNDDEVLSEMNKMVAFIKQEAMEKAREIKVKADEEFAIEKAKLVKQEQQAIDAQYEKKRKGVETAQKIAQSNLTNKSRLKILHKREEQLQELFAAAREEISNFAEDEGRYSQFLEGAALQGYLQLMEPKVTLIARQTDVELVRKAGAAASETYTELSGQQVLFDVVGTLEGDSAGGIKLTNGNKRITIDNTLDERLRLLEDKMLPEIRVDLFGPNLNRKFYT